MPVWVVALNSFLTEPTEMLPDTRNTKFSTEGLVEEAENCSFLLGVLESSDPPPTLPGWSSSRVPGPSLSVAGPSCAGRGVRKESHRLAFPRGAVPRMHRAKGGGKTRLGIYEAG